MKILVHATKVCRLRFGLVHVADRPGRWRLDSGRWLRQVVDAEPGASARTFAHSRNEKVWLLTHTNDPVISKLACDIMRCYSSA